MSLSVMSNSLCLFGRTIQEMEGEPEFRAPTCGLETGIPFNSPRHSISSGGLSLTSLRLSGLSKPIINSLSKCDINSLGIKNIS